MRLLKTVVPIAVLVAAIFVIYTTFFSVSDSDNNTVVEPEASASSTIDNVEGNNSSTISLDAAPATVNTSADGENAVPAASDITDETAEPNDLNTSASNNTSTPAIDYPNLAGYEVGAADISEEELLELVDRLRNDPVLLADLLNELRAETDPARLKRLTIMLGATGSAQVLPVAEELVYSSSPVSRKTGLDLLSRVAPQNAEAYDIANSILGSEADPEVLVSTMNVLARPQNAGPEVKATAVSQIMPLASHESAAVRRHSVAMLVRLTNDDTLSPVLYSALSDTDATVRKAATYAYAEYPFQTSEAVERLIEIIEDPSEQRGVRQGAMLAISKMGPDEATTERVNAAKRQMRDARQ